MLEHVKTVFIVGIKGVAMANLARILTQMGKIVSGSDSAETFITDELLAESNISVINSFKAEDLPPNTNLVIYAASHAGLHNPQVIEAQKRGLKVMHQAEVLGELMNEYKHSLAVCGCHGKTTTTSLLTYALKNLGVDPSFMIGTSTFNNQWAGEFGKKDYFVVEADEYGMAPPEDKTPKFIALNPKAVIALNIDFDHPDVYSTIEETKAAFHAFLSKDSIKRIVACIDSKDIEEVIGLLDEEKIITYGISEKVDVQITNIQALSEGMSFTLIWNNSSEVFRTPLFGEKNVLNTAAVIILLKELGFEIETIKSAFNGFTGAKRRFEEVAFINSTYLFDDYAHHPEEIRTTIASARARFPSERVVIIFQPHTYSRTYNLKDEFVKALSMADQAVILPIFASAREKVTENSISAYDLELHAEKNGIHNIQAVTKNDELINIISQVIKKGDIIFTMGAGDVYKAKNDIITLLEKL